MLRFLTPLLYTGALLALSVLPTSRAQSCQGIRSLTYVIDTTGSMSDEISQVCTQTQLIQSELESSSSRNIYRHFVLVTFNDPNYGPAEKYNSVQNLTAASCALRVTGGGDCPEMALNGLLIALGETCPQSVIYLFTDASAKDMHLLQSVLDSLEKKQIRVVFALSGNGCSGNYQEYQTIATRSGGQVFFLNKNEVSQILAFVRQTLSSRPSGTLLFQRITTISNSSFQVLPGSSALSVSVSCDLNQPQVTVMSPNATERGTTSTTGKSVLMTFNNPTAGRWSMQVHSTGDCSVSVTASSFLSQAFSYYFGLTTGLPQSSPEARSRPINGYWNYQYVNVPSGANLSRVDHMDIRGQVLLTLTVSATTWRSGNVTALGPFIPQNESFFISFSGTTSSGAPFQELSTTTVTPEVGGIVANVCDSVTTAPSEGERLTAYSNCLTSWQQQYNKWLADDGKHCASSIEAGCPSSNTAENFQRYTAIHDCWVSGLKSWRTAYEKWSNGDGRCAPGV